ncbi:MAG: ScpA family protein [Patescibacteria group bacterium]|nr:ScpA family protein [Patescibacteria group bacterium]
MAYLVQVEHFEGPLDLLLQLVEKNELEISDISLAGVTDQFVKYMEAQTVPPEETADFLVVASKLVYLKSKLLMPDFEDEEMEEGMDLEAQLRQYQMFVAAAKELDQMWSSGNVLYHRRIITQRKRDISFVPPKGVDITLMLEVMNRVILRIEPIVRLPKAAVERAVSIHEKIRDLYGRIGKHAKVKFSQFIKGAKHKQEAIVGFLALLELIKQKFIIVNQGAIFEDIDISANPEAPNRDPLAEYSEL